MNPLLQLKKCGQSVWLDYIRRDILVNGKLKKMIEKDGICGLTSNPTIFDKAISGSELYDDSIKNYLKKNPDADVNSLYEYLVIEDIREAADIMKTVFEDSGGKDGFISLEVSPHLAYQTEETMQEARRLWSQVDRPNLLIKVPATREGIPAIETLISEGVNVNVTLMFSLDHYEAVAGAYLKGVERCSHPDRAASVASFFVSRVDTLVDSELEKIGTNEAMRLRGEIAIANSRITYRRFKEIFYGVGFAPLKEKGAPVQRTLWASTSTKNPDYSDVLYVENLIGPDTVNTLPPKTIDAFRDHGKAEVTIDQGVEEAQNNLEKLERVGIRLNDLTEQLQEEGVRKFIDSFDQLIKNLDEKRKKL